MSWLIFVIIRYLELTSDVNINVSTYEKPIGIIIPVNINSSWVFKGQVMRIELEILLVS